MATKKAARSKTASSRKLDPNDELFYEKLGKRGGSRTMKVHGREHYQRIAELAHAARRRNSAQRRREREAADSSK